MTKIFYDVNTQNDLINKDGALYVPNAELIKPNLERLTVYAIRNNIPIAGSVDKHFGTLEYKSREGELQIWGGPSPFHCMNGTDGQEKIEETALWYNPGFFDERPSGGNGFYIPHYLDNTINQVELINGIRKMLEHVSKVKQFKQGLFFEKQNYDVFTNPAFDKFLDLAEVEEAFVYGVLTGVCVKAAVLGMQKRKRRIQCYVIEDAVKGTTAYGSYAAIEEMKQAGAKFIRTDDVI